MKAPWAIDILDSLPLDPVQKTLVKAWIVCDRLMWCCATFAATAFLVVYFK